MNIQVHYQGLDSSPWMDQFMTARVQKLHRYLNGASSILITVRMENRKYSTTLAIHNYRDYAFTADGENLYESFAAAVDKASRTLGEQKRMLKDKINRRYPALKSVA